MNTRRALLVVILLMLPFFEVSDISGCGPFLDTAVFVETQYPRALESFVNGRLGVLQPTYGWEYLFVAYRYISGVPLTPEEQKSITYPRNPYSQAPLENGTALTAAKVPSPQDAWLEARKQVPGANPLQAIDLFRKIDGWRFIQNCNEDAFRNAADILRKRIVRFGADHPGIAAWLTAQDTVFAACSSGTTIPEPGGENLPEILRQDRQYQIAAAYFYSLQYDEAAGRFRAIARDTASPWSPIAPYLAVRCLIRKATVPEEYGKFNREVLSQAETELQDILANPQRSEIHGMARKLLNYVALRLHPLEQLRQLSMKLQDPAYAGEARQNRTDYLYILRNIPKLGLSIEDVRKADPMADWILAFSTTLYRAYAIAPRQSAQSLPSLIAALSAAKPGDPDLEALIGDASKLPKESPAYVTAQYHRARLLLGAGEKDEARDLLDDVLANSRDLLDTSSLNMFLSLRIKLARNLDEFLGLAPRFTDGTIFTTGEKVPESDTLHSKQWFDRDSVEIFNENFSSTELYQAVRKRVLPPNLQKELVGAAWMRAVLAGNKVATEGLIDMLESYFPELKPDLQSYLAAEDPESKQFTLALLILRFPGLSPFLPHGFPPRLLGYRPQPDLSGIDSLGNNWWCGLGIHGDLDAPTGSRRSFPYSDWARERDAANPRREPHDFPSFLKPGVEMLNEWQHLEKAGTAPNYLGKIVLSYAPKHPEDPRVPEALHLVVRATRYGCDDADSGRYSKRAFELLHKKYRNSDWTGKTPYWFE